ncbi:MAG: hypothetical protein ACPGEF_08275 [Endozoicomonas sp.]
MRIYLFKELLITCCVSIFLGCSQVEKKPAVEAESCNSSLVEQLVKQKILGLEGVTNSEKLISYKAGCADLNGDGHQEVLVLMQGIWFCGTGGCSAFIFDDQGNKLSQMSMTDEPILLSAKKHDCWHDLYVWSDGAMRIMAFDGKSYPDNPSMQPIYHNESEIKAAYEKVMTTDIYQQDGHQLRLVKDIPIFHPFQTYTFSFLHYGDPDVEYLMDVNMSNGQLNLTTRPLSRAE